ncbi:MAG: Fe-S cluster assembly protein HesB [Candidatus Korarchaeota archaeon]|nr:Fe-S cluster assembly protein HesB [Candidatus Korarchaeota archaeon]NIU84883.1 Fe-S cluster assembly protein HesB [Candidatus Thorarchaeota archaeon]NIW14909.1 Fe-S cluster assembly protein HesB [Candidatus Thorarchaeota archaeon]NIW52943.1 Fe-S cluster assembly protein HesB [Candidatus Korarchaeota archaeon]
MSIDRTVIQGFQEKIFSWWKNNKREFPWRKTRNPYHILVAEVMLQQTQASRVVEKYQHFITRYPTPSKLAKANTADVLTLWSGLGYNRRALWLQEAAKQIVSMEQFPRTLDELQNLKGVGPYTSRAILIFAFNENIATVDTNIRRILIAEGFADESTSKKELLKIGQQLVPKGRSRAWHNALMDYSSLELTATRTDIRPASSQKPFRGSRREYRGRVVKFLTKHKKSPQKTIIAECNIPMSKVEDVFSSLLNDGLIKKDGNEISLP